MPASTAGSSHALGQQPCTTPPKHHPKPTSSRAGGTGASSTSGVTSWALGDCASVGRWHQDDASRKRLCVRGFRCATSALRGLYRVESSCASKKKFALNVTQLSVWMRPQQLLPPFMTLPSIQAIIFATGYQQHFPFIKDPRVRKVAESGKDVPQLEGSTGPPPSDVKGGAQQRLFLRMVYLPDPTLIFLGLPAECMSPFMVYEAQAKFAAYLLSKRIALPATAAEMDAIEAETPTLFSRRGLGLDSPIYYNALFRLCGLRDVCYGLELCHRAMWAAATSFMSWMYRFRSYAPLRRKQQHIIISNKI